MLIILLLLESLHYPQRKIADVYEVGKADQTKDDVGFVVWFIVRIAVKIILTLFDLADESISLMPMPKYVKKGD
jgi:hypothetical protein